MLIPFDHIPAGVSFTKALQELLNTPKASPYGTGLVIDARNLEGEFDLGGFVCDAYAAHSAPAIIEFGHIRIHLKDWVVFRNFSGAIGMKCIGRSVDGTAGTNFIWEGPARADGLAVDMTKVKTWLDAGAPLGPGQVPTLPTKSPFVFENCAGPMLENLALWSDRTHPALAGILCQRADPAPWHQPGANKFSNISVGRLGGDFPRMFQFGLYLACASGKDWNNSEGDYSRMNLEGATEAAFAIEGGQAKNHRCHDNCSFNNSKHGIATHTSANRNGGSFSVRDSNGSYNEIDLYLGSPCDVINVDGWYGEGSGRLLVTYGGGMNDWAVELSHVTWADNGAAADGEIVQYTERGPFTLRNSAIGYGQNPLMFKLYGNAETTGIAEGNAIGSTLVQPFVSETPLGRWWLRANKVRRGNAFPVFLPDT